MSWTCFREREGPQKRWDIKEAEGFLEKKGDNRVKCRQQWKRDALVWMWWHFPFFLRFILILAHSWSRQRNTRQKDEAAGHVASSQKRTENAGAQGAFSLSTHPLQKELVLTSPSTTQVFGGQIQVIGLAGKGLYWQPLYWQVRTHSPQNVKIYF